MSETPGTGQPPQGQPGEPQGQPSPPPGAGATPPPPPPPPGQPYGQPPPTGQPYGQAPSPGQQYGQPPTGWAPQPMSPSDERTWGLFAHLGALIIDVITSGAFGWLAGLIILMTKGKESAYVRHHAVESLNFQITLIIGVVGSVLVSIPLIFVAIGVITIWLLPLAIAIVGLIFMIMASVAANKGEWYKYPINIRLVK